MTTPFDPGLDCGAHLKQCPECHLPWAACPHAHETGRCIEDVHRCRQRKGRQTDHPGAGNCQLHGGNTPNGRRHAQREAAENVLAKIGIRDRVDPVESLWEAVRVAAWREEGLRHLLQARPRLFGPDHLGDEREDVVSQMHDRALKRRAELARMAIDAGLDERIVRLAERQGEVIHRILTAALDAAGIDGDARTRAEEAVVRELLAVAPSGPELN